MATVHSFTPISRPDAEVLILGSMPGKLSLARHEYYAHPHNLFWRLMGELFGAEPRLPYEKRTETLRSQRVALWDVLKQCDRESSLDSDILPDSMLVNDFPEFFVQHPQIRWIFFNGKTAESVFRRKVLRIMGMSKRIELVCLPSTSPANASIPYSDKLERWKAVRRAFS